MLKCKNCKARCAWAGKDSSEHGQCFVGYDPITNADKLFRLSTIPELAEMLKQHCCPYRLGMSTTISCGHARGLNCQECWEEFLNSDASSNNPEGDCK